MPAVLNKLLNFQKKIIRYQRDATWHLGGSRSVVQQAKGARMLVYHGVCESQPSLYNTLFITQQKFEEQLRLYKKYCALISLDDFYSGDYPTDRLSLCLTFDDGFANNHKYVLPLLEKYQVAAAFFITAVRNEGFDILWNDMLCIAYRFGPGKFTFIDDEFIKAKNGKYWSVTTGEWFADILRTKGFKEKADLIKKFEHLKEYVPEDYWMQLSVDQIAEMASCKWVTIGSHSYYHNDLAKLEEEELTNDIRQSKQFLQTVTGRPIRSIAYPYGSYNDVVLKKSVEAGYSKLLATDLLSSKDEMNTLLKERLTINPFISNTNQFYANVSGYY